MKVIVIEEHIFCPNCRSHLVYNKDDIKTSIFFLNHAYIKCPVCNKKIFLGVHH